MDNRIKIIISDDHDLYVDGLSRAFENHPIYQVIDYAFNGEELIRKAVQWRPQIVLTDLKMPIMSGAKAIQELSTRLPDTLCLVLTSFENDMSIIEALEAGAKGYITKNMPKTELFIALDQISKGYPYFCKTTSSKMIRLIGNSRFNPYENKERPQFTDHERKIIQKICEGKTNKEIAEEICESIRTIENNRYRIYKKMNVKTPAGLVVFAIKNSMFTIDD